MTQGILLIEDEALLARNICIYLERERYSVHVASSGEDGLDVFEHLQPQAVLLDYNLPGISGMQVLERIKACSSQTRVIMMTGQGNEQTAIAALKAGASDYLKKPIELAALRLVIERALARRRLSDIPEAMQQAARRQVMDTLQRRRMSDFLGNTVPAAGQPEGPGVRLTSGTARPVVHSSVAALVGTSEQMQLLKTLMMKLIDADLRLENAEPPPVLITGETGTGKELVARALHAQGRRKSGPFVEVNCAGIPTNLLEAELFGHERGAFTDAKEAKRGLIESASGGSLFLDEIGDLEPVAQSKLLKVLDERRVRPIGSLVERQVDTRFIAATSRDLEKMVRDGQFRADLYYRLRMIRIQLPPLRARSGDVSCLAEHFVQLYGARYGKPGARLSDSAMAKLNSHIWPGNVRELKSVIEQALVLSEGGEISATDLCMQELAPASTGSLCMDEFAAPEVEREMLATALRQTRSNISKAARMLGISRDTLRYRVKKYEINY